jgi:RNA polymerase sigma factor (sigma-70 family)
MAEGKALSTVEAADLTDEVLLERYTSHRDEAAFAVLVRRHGPLVLGTCRRLLQHEQDAEDAFQAVLCVLARRARSIHHRAALGVWLHAVAYRIACKARAGRQRQPVSAVPLPDVPVAERSPEWLWGEIRAVLDEEVDRLPEKYRQAFTLCYLEHRTTEQAAAQLGCPQGTILSRLARARERLRSRLTRRGLALSAAALTAALASQASPPAVRAELASAAVQTALHYASSQPPATGVARLADGFLKAQARARLTITLGLVAAVAALILVVLLLWFFVHRSGLAFPPQTDQDRLQGSWQVLAMEKAGQPRAENPGMQFVFAGNQLTLSAGGAPAPSMRFVLGSAQEPKAIDFTRPDGKVLRGLYQLDGDSLQVCLDFDQAGPGAKRPTSFRPEPGVTLFIMRREQPLPGRPR